MAAVKPAKTGDAKLQGPKGQPAAKIYAAEGTAAFLLKRYAVRVKKTPTAGRDNDGQGKTDHKKSSEAGKEQLSDVS